MKQRQTSCLLTKAASADGDEGDNSEDDDIEALIERLPVAASASAAADSADDEEEEAVAAEQESDSDSDSDSDEEPVVARKRRAPASERRGKRARKTT